MARLQMKRTLLSLGLLPLLSLGLLLLSSTGWAASEYHLFVFDPNQSTVIESGGWAGVYETYDIWGMFGLSVDYDANTAYFTDVNAQYVWPPNSLGGLFDMENLAGSVVCESLIEFEDTNSLLGSVQIDITAALSGNTVHLTGQRLEPWPDGFQHDLDAVAQWWANARVVPDNPTAADEVAVTVYGRWPSGCIPVEFSVQVVDSNIYFRVFSFDSNDCPSGMVPWQLTETVGPLGEGKYEVHVALDEGPWMRVLEFSVSGAYYVDGINGDDLNDGLSLATAFATIQRGVYEANDGDVVLVYPAVYGSALGDPVYGEAVNFEGKAITVEGVATEAGIAVLDTLTDYAVSFYNDEGRQSVLKNFVIRNSYLAVFMAGASPTIKNLTVVDNDFGMAAYAGSEPDISNCIFYNNADGDLFGCSARHSWLLEEPNEPLFADVNTGDYHLLSERGRHRPSTGEWILDEATSPCVDGGDPNINPMNERMPNGGRINMGAYGGTPYASMSEWPLAGDVSRDGVVNFRDIAIVAGQWLSALSWALNEPPTVSITSPDGSSIVPYNTIEPVVIYADAFDTDGTVVKVEFFADGGKVAEDSNGSDGWQGAWHPSSDGLFTLTATATDDDGATATSAPVEVQIGYVW